MYTSSLSGGGYHRKVEHHVRCSSMNCPRGSFRLLMRPTNNFYIDLDEAANEEVFTNVSVRSSAAIQSELDSSVADSFTAVIHKKFDPFLTELNCTHNLHIRYHPSTTKRYVAIQQPIIEAYYEPTERELKSAKTCEILTLIVANEDLKVISISSKNFNKELIKVPTGTKNSMIVIITVFVTCFGTFYSSACIFKLN